MASRLVLLAAPPGMEQMYSCTKSPSPGQAGQPAYNGTEMSRIRMAT